MITDWGLLSFPIFPALRLKAGHRNPEFQAVGDHLQYCSGKSWLGSAADPL